MSGMSAEIRAACHLVDTAAAPASPQVKKPYPGGLRCVECQVGWLLSEDGDTCWVCGGPGT